MASDLKAQRYCEAAMRFNGSLTLAAGHPDPAHRSSPTTSQMGQDVLIWRNYFSALTVRKEIGYYVDSGANDATWGSNTWFYDHCLGWKGLCVEAQFKYWHRLRASLLQVDQKVHRCRTQEHDVERNWCEGRAEPRARHTRQRRAGRMQPTA